MTNVLKAVILMVAFFFGIYFEQLIFFFLYRIYYVCRFRGIFPKVKY
jgi:hypothetical protein